MIEVANTFNTESGRRDSPCSSYSTVSAGWVAPCRTVATSRDAKPAYGASIDPDHVAVPAAPTSCRTARSHARLGAGSVVKNRDAPSPVAGACRRRPVRERRAPAGPGEPQRRRRQGTRRFRGNVSEAVDQSPAVAAGAATASQPLGSSHLLRGALFHLAECDPEVGLGPEQGRVIVGDEPPILEVVRLGALPGSELRVLARELPERAVEVAGLPLQRPTR